MLLSYLSVFQLIAIFVQNMLPLQIVDSEFFVDFVQTCIPGKRSLSRRTLTRRVEEKFSIEKTKPKEILQDVSSVATTADLWTCRNR